MPSIRGRGRRGPGSGCSRLAEATGDPKTGRVGRHHLHESVMQRAMTVAVRASGIGKRASCHTLRQPFATHLLEAGHDIRTVQELLGPRDVTTTMICTHVLIRGGRGAGVLPTACV